MAMKYQISRFSILQTAKVVALIYVLFGLILIPFGCILIALSPDDTTSLAVGIFYLLGPILYGLIGFVFTAIGLWVYNLISARIGGIEFELRGPEPNSLIVAASQQ